MTEYTKENHWYGWNGGECPVHPETSLEVAFDDGNIAAQRRAGDWGWVSGHGIRSIIAFRIIKLHREPREFWVFENGHGDLVASRTWRDRAIHVREVLQ